MATIKTDPQTTKNIITQNIIKDITTTQLCSYQIGHKYKLSKITIGNCRLFGIYPFLQQIVMILSTLIQRDSLSIANRAG